MTIKQFIIKPEKFFLCCAIVSAIFMIIFTPPYQAPDEYNHLFRAYQISEGQFLPLAVDNRLGGYVPESMIQSQKKFSEIRFNEMAKSNGDLIKKEFSVKLSPGNKVFTDFPNTALYSPVSYLPQALVISILRNFNAPPVLLLYAGRIAGFLFWMICLFIAIRYIPLYKWLYTILALLPMSVFINTAFSADIVTNSIAFLFIGFALNKKFSERYLSKKDLLFLYSAAVLIAMAKIVYAPVILLICIIPKSKFKSGMHYYGNLISIFSLVFFVMALWSGVVTRNYIPYSEYNITYRSDAELPVCSNMYLQKAGIQEEGLSKLSIIPNSIHRDFEMYASGYIGTFGWMDTHLPGWFIWVVYFVIFILSFTENNKGLRLGIKTKIIFLFGFMLSCLLLILSQYLIWECVGNDFVRVIQGRYLIPVAPLFFMSLETPLKLNNKFVSFITITSSIFFLSFSIIKIHDRYYKYAFQKPLSVSCNFDGTRWGEYFKTSNKKIYLSGAGLQSAEQSRSGNYSCKLNNASPYGPALLFYGGEKHDRIIAEAWIYGQGGKIAISGFTGIDSVFYAAGNLMETNNSGWKKIQLDYPLMNDMHGYPLYIFLWSPSHEKIYFDDIAINISTNTE